MTSPIDIRSCDLKIVQRILSDTLHVNAKVWVFGSRATWKTKRSSDLDLAIDAGRPLIRKECSDLAEAFDESDLPYKVDVVDMHKVSATFKAIIERDMVQLERNCVRYSRYEKYKETGIEWLPQVPAHWEVKRLKYIASIRASNVDKKSLENQPSVELCNYTDVYYNERITSNMQFMKATASTNQIKDFLLKSGDVLITKDSESPDDIAIASFVPKTLENVICGYHLAHITPKKICGEYLFRAFQSTQYRQYFEVCANGITRYGIGKLAIDNAPFLFAPFPEQKAIATFLDEKTGKIDTLLEKLKLQKELLTEKRTALITGAVTRGLHPNVPMKETGIEWLPQVPAHWEVKRLKYIASIRASNVDKKSLENQPSVELCNYTDVYYNERITSNMQFMKATASTNQIKDFLLKSGDVLITKDSESPDDIAIASFVPKTLENVICGYHLAHITPKKIYGEYLFRAFQSTQYRQYFEVCANGITRYGIGKLAIDNAPFLFAPLPEQKTIAEYLDKQTAKVDLLQSKIDKQIELLKEYRTSLITAAVTGQIKISESTQQGQCA